MLITPKKTPFALPQGFLSSDLVSINFRHFATWMSQDNAEKLNGFVCEIRFPWTHEALAENRAKRLNGFAQQTIKLMATLDQALGSARCTTILSETTKHFSSVAVCSPLPQVVMQALQNMSCPDEYAVPEVFNFDLTAGEYIAHRAKTLSTSQ